MLQTETDGSGGRLTGRLSAWPEPVPRKKDCQGVGEAKLSRHISTCKFLEMTARVESDLLDGPASHGALHKLTTILLISILRVQDVGWPMSKGRRGQIGPLRTSKTSGVTGKWPIHR